MSFSDSVPEHIQRIPPYKSENPAEEMERDSGLKTVQLGMNENPFGPSPKGVEAARTYMENVAPYPDDSGFQLRRKLAGHFGISMDELIISSGSSDILAMAYHAVFTPEAEVITGEASFIVYYQLAEMLNMPMVRVPMKNYGFDLERIGSCITSRTRLVLLANPNNPTGTIIRRRQLDEFMIVPAKSILLTKVTAGTNTIGLRWPIARVATSLIESLGKPITATSANSTGMPTPITAAEVRVQIGEAADALIDGGTLPFRAGSTLLDLTVDPAVVLREGPITGEELADFFGGRIRRSGE